MRLKFDMHVYQTEIGIEVNVKINAKFRRSVEKVYIYIYIYIYIKLFYITFVLALFTRTYSCRDTLRHIPMENHKMELKTI